MGALDVGAWQDVLVGGRVFRTSRGWIDAATGTPVRLRAWLVDSDRASRWVECHDDARDAWVVRGAGGWVGVRLDAAAGTRCPALLTMPVDLPADLSPTGAAATLRWASAARWLARAGYVPCAPASLRWLAEWSPAWWGPVVATQLPDDGATAAALAVRSFVRRGGRVRALRAAGSRPDASWETMMMGDREGPDGWAQAEQEDDPARAIELLCEGLRQRLRGRASGAATPLGAAVARAGPSEPPPAAWLQAVARGVGPPCLVTAGHRYAGASAGGAGGATGVLWVAWPSREPVGPGALDVLGACAARAADRLARLAVAPVPTTRAAAVPASRLTGDSPAMAQVRRQLENAARSPFPVLILGESGVGKELAARTVHEAGPRRQRRFVAMNAAALPDDLLEAELFGHARGAFTGAVGERPGVFEEADGGTLFLDEVGDLSARAQVKLLRVLQEGEVRRLGEAGQRRVDVRLIAATNAVLEQAVAAGSFRADLYYRLAVVCVRVPPLRERRADIPALIDAYWAECARRVGTRARLHPSLVERLQAHDWPGNVRELQNVLATLAVEAPRHGVVLPTALVGWAAPRAPALAVAPLPPAPASPLPLNRARQAFDAALVRDALARAGGRRTVAARQLGVSRQGLSKLVRRLGLGTADAGPS